MSRGTDGVMGPGLSAESYWIPSHIVDSAWLQHGAFASWIVAQLRPRMIVELGTHNGFSYFAFCEAVTRLSLDTRCFALDTWRGDDHAGFYDEQVYTLVSSVNESQFGDFSTLMRGYFDESLTSFEDGSIDLLHIDGRHGYDDAKHDFESWLPKLSQRGVVLFHDIAEHDNGFEVWRLWDEVSCRYPSFHFEFGHGLGVIAVGTRVPESLQALFAAEGEIATRIRASYEALGGRIFGLYALLADRARLSIELDSASQGLAQLTAQHNALVSSIFWRAMRPARWIFRHVPEGMKRRLRGSATS